MFDFILNVCSEIVDFFLDLWTDKMTRKFTSKKDDRSKSGESEFEGKNGRNPGISL